MYQVYVNDTLKDEYAVEANAQAHVEMAKRLGNSAYYEAGSEVLSRPLSQTQIKVLCKLARGGETSRGEGRAILIDRKKACDTQTIEALKNRGLIEASEPENIQNPKWKLTEFGRALARKLIIGK